MDGVKHEPEQKEDDVKGGRERRKKKWRCMSRRTRQTAAFHRRLLSRAKYFKEIMPICQGLGMYSLRRRRYRPSVDPQWTLDSERGIPPDK